MGFLDKISGLGKKSKKKDDKKTASVKSDGVNSEIKEKKSEYSTLKLKGEISAPTSTDKTKSSDTGRKKKETTGDAYKILLEPLVTEKATDLSVKNKYCFKIDRNANKIQVKKAIFDLYGVKPMDVNVIQMKGKIVRYGQVSGKKKNWKKAIVTLKPGDKIEIYEGV